MRILLLITFIYCAHNLAMDHTEKSNPRSVSNCITISQSETNPLFAESPNAGLALKSHLLGKSVSPERARTPALPNSPDSKSNAKREYIIYEQVITAETYMSALRQRLLEIFAQLREDKYMIGSKELGQRLLKHISEEEKLLTLLKKSPTPAELAAHLLKEPGDRAVVTWKEQAGAELKIDDAFLKEKIRDAQEEIAATRIALFINQQKLEDAPFRQPAP